MLTAADHTEVGTLISCALQPTLRPGRSPEYRRLLARYRGEPEFRIAVDGVLLGLNAKVLSDGEFGLILGVERESPFSFRASDLPYQQNPRNRLLAGLVTLGLAAWAFPNPAELEESRPRHVPDVEFEEWLRSACARFQVRDDAGETVPEEGLDQSWRVYLEMPSTMVGEKGRGTGRLSPGCTLYWVRAVLGWLAEQGMARNEQVGDGEGEWVLTERFRINVKDMAAEPAYRLLAEIGREENAA